MTRPTRSNLDLSHTSSVSSFILLKPFKRSTQRIEYNTEAPTTDEWRSCSPDTAEPLSLSTPESRRKFFSQFSIVTTASSPSDSVQANKKSAASKHKATRSRSQPTDTLGPSSSSKRRRIEVQQHGCHPEETGTSIIEELQGRSPARATPSRSTTPGSGKRERLNSSIRISGSLSSDTVHADKKSTASKRRASRTRSQSQSTLHFMKPRSQPDLDAIPCETISQS
jgi:hypothetical protein